jgi:hypothetical protein
MQFATLLLTLSRFGLSKWNFIINCHWQASHWKWCNIPRQIVILTAILNNFPSFTHVSLHHAISLMTSFIRCKKWIRACIILVLFGQMRSKKATDKVATTSCLKDYVCFYRLMTITYPSISIASLNIMIYFLVSVNAFNLYKFSDSINVFCVC